MTDRRPPRGQVRLGAVYPQTELNGAAAAVRSICDALESSGYDHLLAYDHVLGAVHHGRTPPMPDGGYSEQDPFHDPFVLFAYLAGRTQRLKFVTGVIILPQRQTVIVAKQAASLALLSDNRLRLGVGLGWNFVEYEGLGQDFSTRGARLDEQVPLLRQLWTQPVIHFDGRFDHIDRAGILPRPHSTIPIWLGGSGERAFHRAARLGDGFIFTGPWSDMPAQWRRMQQVLAEQDRSGDDVRCRKR